MADTTRAEGSSRRAGISFFGPPSEAPSLEETEVMSFPVVEEAHHPQFFEWGLSGGHLVKVLFTQDGGEGREGLSLVWSWFGPNHVLPRHSHSADCLYYVLSGEAHLGNRVVGAGSGFFVPADAPYAYAAGPEGIQILEFRNVTSFDMQVSESGGRWDRIVETVRANTEAWKAEAARG